jgi:hypothetical protein
MDDDIDDKDDTKRYVFFLWLISFIFTRLNRVVLKVEKLNCHIIFLYLKRKNMWTINRT